jgi:TPR repeat protein
VAGAARGEAGALFRLGACYLAGLGVPQSYERAAELYTQAVSKGHADAQTCLGALYCKGLGVPKDVARGVALFKQAAAGGIKEAADALRTLGEAVPPGVPA